MKYKCKLSLISSRKIQLGLLVLLTLLFLPACQKCELIEQVVTPPVAKCEGTFYIMNAEESMGFFYNLHEFPKPVPEPYVSVSLAGPFFLPPSLFDIQSNFSAYDSIGKRYVYIHHFGTGADFFSLDIGAGTPTRTQEGRIDMCPVFHKHSRKLYSIFTEQIDPTSWLYNIVDIDLVTGAGNSVIGGDVVQTNSPMYAESMSAVSTFGDKIYFLSGTNLIEVNLGPNTFRYMDIDPTFNSIDNFVQYFGLEYKRDEGVLLAMKNSTNSMTNEMTTTLVSIRVTSGAPVLTTLFNISSGMSNLLEPFVNPEFYSSTFDPCDNTYYATAKQGGFDINTSFIEINLPKNEMKLKTLEGFWYGLEYINK